MICSPKEVSKCNSQQMPSIHQVKRIMLQVGNRLPQPPKFDFTLSYQSRWRHLQNHEQQWVWGYWPTASRERIRLVYIPFLLPVE